MSKVKLPDFHFALYINSVIRNLKGSISFEIRTTLVKCRWFERDPGRMQDKFLRVIACYNRNIPVVEIPTYFKNMQMIQTQRKFKVRDNTTDRNCSCFLSEEDKNCTFPVVTNDTRNRDHTRWRWIHGCGLRNTVLPRKCSGRKTVLKCENTVLRYPRPWTDRQRVQLENWPPRVKDLVSEGCWHLACTFHSAPCTFHSVLPTFHSAPPTGADN